MTVELQPATFGTTADLSAHSELNKIGVRITDVTDEIAGKLGFAAKTEGAVITEIAADGIAANAGLQRGMLIIKVDQQPCKSAREVEAALRQEQPLKRHCPASPDSTGRNDLCDAQSKLGKVVKITARREIDDRAGPWHQLAGSS